MPPSVEEPIRFAVADLVLEGAWAAPAGAERAAVLCHPHPLYGGTMDDHVVQALARALRDAGVATLRFNFRGVGASEGRHDGGEGEVLDARGAVALVRARLPGAEITLAGYSFGAMVALRAAAANATLARVVAVAPPIAVAPLGVPVSTSTLFVVGDRDPYCSHVVLADAAGPGTVVVLPATDHFFIGREAALVDPVVRFVTRAVSGPRLACDSLVALAEVTADGSVVFAKNSDRVPPTECQPLVQAPRRRHAPGARLRCQYVEIEQVRETARLIGSHPYWCWGFEHGMNEHGVAIGNHTVFTRDPLAGLGLIGMDLVRLGLERGTSASHAVEVLTTLIERHGQGGSGYVDKDWPYHNSFVIADRGTAYLLETSDRRWAARRIRDLGSASNHLSIGDDWDALAPGTIAHAIARGWWRDGDPRRFDFAAAFRDTSVAPSFISSGRHARTRALLQGARGHITPATLRAALRDHYGGGPAGASEWPWDDERRYSVCLHVPAVGTTTASVVAWLGRPDEPLVYWASLGSPCVGVFLPYYVEGVVPAILGVGGERPTPESPWWGFHELLGLVARDVARRGPAVRARWDAFEAEVEEARPAIEARARREGPQVLTAFMEDNVRAMREHLVTLTAEMR